MRHTIIRTKTDKTYLAVQSFVELTKKNKEHIKVVGKLNKEQLNAFLNSTKKMRGIERKE